MQTDDVACTIKFLNCEILEYCFKILSGIAYIIDQMERVFATREEINILQDPINEIKEE